MNFSVVIENKKMKSDRKFSLPRKCRYLYTKYFSRIAEVLGALFIFCMICNVLNYLYVRYDECSRILWHNFYEDDGKIDNICLGTSHVHCDINPMLLGDINGQYNFNLSAPSVPLNGSYYFLREADKNNVLSHVYLELYYSCCVKDNFHSDIDWIDWAQGNNWIILTI